ncbi:glycoside hydrolase family 127 protein [Acidaminobacter sp. JC074]|uniref:glycoside hydrolase family 127 protein n=1 Tax=Acidaminobacter sp. JC074 TaxID=2530199 RepID=UPI001F0CF847|nr:beta-L-arabinofuranosidase domain-containing protein [Acidaminobacter sp. JC074]MCH4890141.1 glycoside hydrolase family 127 protein [Acidaminobacter sp. JC074]
MKKVSFDKVKILSEFWNERIETVRSKTIWQVLDKCNESRVRNFEAAGMYLSGDKSQVFEGRFYDDSDVYKALEGLSYLLVGHYDENLMKQADEIIDKIASAQWHDGYISTYFTLTDEDRYSDMDRHELYCGGHLIEAAIAYYKATGKDALLNVAIKLADHWVDYFHLKNWVCGHPEAELALFKLYELTNEIKYKELSLYLLEQRGKGFYKSESRPICNQSNFYTLEYAQDHEPVKKQVKVKGHAVRAMYLYTAMAMLGYPVKALFEDLVKHMYITGGIGDSIKNEGFSDDNNMKNENAYAETCASIGCVFFADNINDNLNQHEIIESQIYNNILAGLSADGQKFFYVNPMVTNGLNRKEGGHKERSPWFTTSCCPTNLTRFIPSIGSYIYRYTDDVIYINQHIGSEVTIEGVNITLKTDYPRGGHFEIDYDGNIRFKKIYFRLPSWIKTFRVSESYGLENDYIMIDLKESASFSIDFELEVRKLSTPLIDSNKGKSALAYGPFVYCFEGKDSRIEFLEDDYDIIWNDELKVHTQVNNYEAIPYYIWGNRGKSAMKVFVKEKGRD